MSEYHDKRAAEIIKQIRYATLATVTPEGLPWNSPVAHEYDNSLNIYWVSDKEGQHSKNVTANNKVFIVIYDSTVPEGDGEGVYIQANVEQVIDPEEILKVRRIKKGSHFEQSPDSFLGDSIRYMYKAVPQKVWMNDAEVNDGVFIKDFRVEISLEVLRDLLVTQDPKRSV
jgi:general stress protein 26